MTTHAQVLVHGEEGTDDGENHTNKGTLTKVTNITVGVMRVEISLSQVIKPYMPP